MPTSMPTANTARVPLDASVNKGGRAIYVAVCAVLIMWMTMVGAARADGGSSIAGATPVTFGQQQFGNTTNGGLDRSAICVPLRSWWSLPIVAGDRLTIDWETHSRDTDLLLMPIGTTDFSFTNARPSATQEPGANLKNELTHTATVTGVLSFFFADRPLGCLTPGPGPYSFTVYVKHALVLAIPRFRTLQRAGTVRVGVRNPDGGPINDPALSVVLVVKSGRRTLAVGAAPPLNGFAAIRFRLPKSLEGRRVYVRAKATGADYLAKTSSVQRVKIR